MNILVTGSSGFIGTSFIQLSLGHNIKEVDLLSTLVRNIDFTGIDSVLHLAAIVHQRKGVPAENYFKVNRDLTYEIANQAKRNGVKHFVFMSTSKVYGELHKNDAYWNEESTCNPIDPYGKSKFQAEKLIQMLDDDVFKVSIIRSPLVYGPGVKANMLNLIKLVDNCPVLPFGDLDNKRSIVYINNLVALIYSVLEAQASGVFIAGDKSPISTMDLIRLISSSLGKKRIMLNPPSWFLKLAEFLMPELVKRLYGSLVLDNSSTNFKLNFNPPYTTNNGVQNMVNWYKTIK